MPNPLDVCRSGALWLWSDIVRLMSDLSWQASTTVLFRFALCRLPPEDGQPDGGLDGSKTST